MNKLQFWKIIVGKSDSKSLGKKRKKKLQNSESSFHELFSINPFRKKRAQKNPRSPLEIEIPAIQEEAQPLVSEYLQKQSSYLLQIKNLYFASLTE